MNLPIDAFTPDELIKHLITESRACRGGYLMTPNLDNLRGLTRSSELMSLAQGADVRVADGMPLVWASRIRGTPLPARVAGSDLVFSLGQSLAGTGLGLYLLGGEPGTADRAADKMQERFPALRIQGTYCPPYGFEHDPSELAQIRSALYDASPDFVYLGLPFPKASALATKLRESFPSIWFLGLGISFSFICGDVRRAPGWMQRLGLEWVHRLVQEPRRLGRRYLLEGLPFATELLWKSLLDRQSGSERKATLSRTNVRNSRR